MMDAYGYLRALHAVFGKVPDTTLRLDEDEASSLDPADDAPWSVYERIQLREP